MKRRISYRIMISLAIVMTVCFLGACGSQNDYEEDDVIDVEEFDSSVIEHECQFCRRCRQYLVLIVLCIWISCHDRHWETSLFL